MNVFQRIIEVDKYIGIIIFFLMTFSVFLQVLLRTINMPIVGADEFQRYLFIALVYLSLAYAGRTSGHIRVDFIREKLPGAMEKNVRNFVNLLTTVVFGVVAVSAVITLSTNLENKTPTLGIPFVIFFLPTALGFILATIQSIAHLAKEFDK